MFAGDIHQLLVAFPLGTLVSNEREVRVTGLTEFTHYATIIELVVEQELLGVVVDFNVNLQNIKTINYYNTSKQSIEHIL